MARYAKPQTQGAAAYKRQTCDKRVKLSESIAAGIRRWSKGKAEKPVENFAARLLADLGLPPDEILQLVDGPYLISRPASEALLKPVCQVRAESEFQKAA